MELSTFKLVLLPDFITTSYHIILYVLFVISTILMLLLNWAILTKSPPEMRVYRWYILCHSVFGYIFSALSGLLHPQFLLPYPSVLLGGIFDILNIDPSLSIFVEDFIGFLLVIMFYNLCFMFLYRYAQTIKHPFLGSVLENFNFAIIFHPIMLTLLSILIVFPLHFNWLMDPELKALLQQNVPFVYEEFKNRHLIGFKEFPLTQFIIFSIELTITAIVAIFSIFGVYRHLLQNKIHLIRYTCSLYHQLINALVVDTLLYMGLIGGPLFIMFLCMKIWPEYIYVVSTVSFFIFGIYAVASKIVLIVFITPYRRALVQLLQRNRFCHNQTYYVERHNTRIHPNRAINMHNMETRT